MTCGLFKKFRNEIQITKRVEVLDSIDLRTRVQFSPLPLTLTKGYMLERITKLISFDDVEVEETKEHKIPTIQEPPVFKKVVTMATKSNINLLNLLETHVENELKFSEQKIVVIEAQKELEIANRNFLSAVKEVVSLHSGIIDDASSRLKTLKERQ